MRFIDIKTDGGRSKGKIAFYCNALGVTRQGFYWYLKHRDDPWKYESIAEKIRGIAAEDECNDTYGRCRMYQALKLKYPDENIPSERTVYRIMSEIGLGHRPRRKPNGITKADRNARKSDDLLKRDFRVERPLEKCVTDITEIPAQDGKLYVSAIFDCYDLGVLGLAMADKMPKKKLDGPRIFSGILEFRLSLEFALAFKHILCINVLLLIIIVTAALVMLYHNT